MERHGLCLNVPGFFWVIHEKHNWSMVCFAKNEERRRFRFCWLGIWEQDRKKFGLQAFTRTGKLERYCLTYWWKRSKDLYCVPMLGHTYICRKGTNRRIVCSSWKHLSFAWENSWMQWKCMMYCIDERVELVGSILWSMSEYLKNIVIKWTRPIAFQIRWK